MPLSPGDSVTSPAHGCLTPNSLGIPQPSSGQLQRRSPRMGQGWILSRVPCPARARRAKTKGWQHGEQLWGLAEPLEVFLGLPTACCASQSTSPGLFPSPELHPVPLGGRMCPRCQCHSPAPPRAVCPPGMSLVGQEGFGDRAQHGCGTGRAWLGHSQPRRAQQGSPGPGQLLLF